ncbi:unnamed protein product [Arabis nemorensis]|uniref:Uncharacterized protein n=1 Tax=Arabis nemorensis TaxID=586526 RepID=A0A565BGW8_9BRAS|nr:unnamed protein product [Arabis nemorensis]
MIPRLVETVQVAIRRMMNKDSRSFNEHRVPIPTQEVTCKAAEELDWEAGPACETKHGPLAPKFLS